MTPVSVSSSRSYDASLNEIFPYHAKVTMEEGQELASLLSRGHKHGPNLEYEYYPSFALMMNFNGGGRLGGKVLWMSDAAINLLQAHEDLYELIITDHTAPRTWTD
ncbi:Hypothetical Protein OBI_RACECAR_203 [Arthrobacter phage Racecar]|nr:hypothetical protein PBI_RACECAR_285 [Arthrobacter phage Racecar]QFG12924.1 hypothetical protein PBI_MIMI_282 [Arthrobacter phage Mimi]